jgi:hypothetical protein
MRSLPGKGRVILWLFILAGALCYGNAFAEKIAKPGADPIQAELIADLHARLLKVGSTVYARVTVEWRSSACALKSGAILEAHVVSVVPSIKPAKFSEVGLAFTRAQCGDQKMGPFPLLLSAVAAPPSPPDLGVMSESLPVRPMSGVNGQIVLNSMRISNDPTLQLISTVYLFPLIPRMEMGEVYRIRGLKLSVGTGPENSSILTAKDRDVALEKHTLLLLVPARWTITSESGETGNIRPEPKETAISLPSVATVPPPVRPPSVNDIELCVPPQCNEALPSGKVTDVGHPATTISIRGLGYTPRPQRDAFGFIYDEVLAYLGPRELLVAFNPHELVPRDTGSTVRIIRAAVLDTETHRVTHTVDWQLTDNYRYLWPLSDGRVLVHVGRELRVYGSGLQVQNRISLDGPLAFVRVTPDGSFMVVGVLHERHSAELHAQLRETLDAEPEEDVHMMVLNRSFETIAGSTIQSNLMPPTLLNEGQATMIAQSNMRYRISLRTWDNHESTLARFLSSCTPELSSISPNLLFLVSCDKQVGGREYRVLRANGKLALKGDSTLNECGHAAEGSANQEAFVVKVVESTLAVPPGAPMNASQFSSEDLRVYRVADGKRLASVRAGPPSLSRDGYALSPDALQLAVLTRDQLAIYSVPPK